MIIEDRQQITEKSVKQRLAHCVMSKTEASDFKSAVRLASYENMLADFDNTIYLLYLLPKYLSPHQNTYIPSAPSNTVSMHPGSAYMGLLWGYHIIS